MSEQTNVELISLRVDQLERENERLQKNQESNTASIEQAKGRSGLISVVGPALITLVGMIFGSVIYAQLMTSQQAAAENGLEIAKLQGDADRADELRNQFEKHAQATGHPELIERVKVLENASADDVRTTTSFLAKQTEIKGLVDRAHLLIKKLEESEEKSGDAIGIVRSDLTKLTGLVERAHMLIDKNSQDHNRVDAIATQNQHSIAAMAASTQANFQEVETQIRSIAEVRLTEMRNIDRYISMIWQEVFENAMPDYDHTPSKIPASATSTLGEIKTNGK